MEDTLRYFFSAVFQGIAAIIALGSMFFIYYLDKIEIQKKIIKNDLINEFNFSVVKIDVSKIGIIEFTKQHLAKITDEKKKIIFELKLKEYERLEEREKIKNQIPSFLKLAIIILVISLISLFFVGYHYYLNLLLIFTGVITVLMTIFYLKELLKLILKILDINK